MLNSPKISRNIDSHDTADPKERMKATLEKLQVLKDRITEVRIRCEELQKMRPNTEKGSLRCEECGKDIRPDQVIEAKYFGKKPQYYHKTCFRKLWQK